MIFSQGLCTCCGCCLVGSSTSFLPSLFLLAIWIPAQIYSPQRGFPWLPHNSAFPGLFDQASCSIIPSAHSTLNDLIKFVNLHTCYWFYPLNISSRKAVNSCLLCTTEPFKEHFWAMHFCVFQGDKEPVLLRIDAPRMLFLRMCFLKSQPPCCQDVQANPCYSRWAWEGRSHSALASPYLETEFSCHWRSPGA